MVATDKVNTELNRKLNNEKQKKNEEPERKQKDANAKWKIISACLHPKIAVRKVPHNNISFRNLKCHRTVQR